MSEPAPIRRPRPPLPRWKKALLVASVLAFVAGAGLKGYSYIARDDAGSSGRQVSTDPSKGPDAGDLTGSLVEGTGGMSRQPRAANPDAGAEASSPGESLSPLLMHGGLSFFVGFCIAYAVRTFFKVSAFFIGAGLLLFFALQYFGIVPALNWQAMEGHFQTLMASVSRQLAGFKAFVEGHLPSTAAATAGAFTGWKRS